MQKIKITSTTKINKPKALENIDISYGISFVTHTDFDIVTVNESDSYFMKLFAALDKLGYVFMNKSKKHENNTIIKQILEDTNFIAKHHSETIDNLELQINVDTMMTKRIKSISLMQDDNMKNYVDENISLLASNFDKKKIFLGINMFKPGDELFDELSKLLTREEIVSFVLFHEYSHSAEFDNNLNYNRQGIANHFDRLYHNLSNINNYDSYSAVQKLIKDDNNLQLPSISLLNTLTLLHQEMYADVRAVLLMRNKDIINGVFNEDNIEKRIKAISQLRKIEKNAVREDLAENDVISFNHFTAPSLECLDKQLKFFISRENNDVLLNEEDMHTLTIKCVQEGIGRTLLAMGKADENLYKQINTLFCVEINDKLVVEEGVYSEVYVNHNQYIYARHEINDIVSPEFKENFNKNVEKIENINLSIVFDAALDYETFEKRLKQPKEEIYQVSSEVLQKSFNSISNAIEEMVNQNSENIKVVAARISNIRDNQGSTDNTPKLK